MHVTGATLAGLVSLLLMGTGCRTADLTKGGSAVQISPSAPVDHGFDPQACKSLGYLSGRGGGTFGGGYISNDQLVQYAMNDLRNQAAQLGANYVQHDSPQLGVGGGENTTTTTATVNGTAYLCEGAPAQARPAASTAPAETGAATASTAPKAPTGAGGFALGDAAATAEGACTGAKHEWTAGETTMECSGTPKSVGFPARARLKTCHGKICEIAILAAPALEEHAWRARYADVRSALEGKYGKPAHKDNVFPASCKETMLACIQDGTAHLESRWKWSTGESVTLSVARHGEVPALDIVYSVEPSRFEPEPAL